MRRITWFDWLGGLGDESEQEDFEWSPVEGSERRLEKEKCGSCDGKGRTVTSVLRKCKTCKGIGWIENEGEGEILCPECKGMREAEYEQSKACQECEEKGYSVRIVQASEAVVECQECEGSGKIECSTCKGRGTTDLPSTETCETCEGVGYTEGEFSCSPAEWEQSELRSMLGKKLHSGGNKTLLASYKLGAQATVSFVKCDCVLRRGQVDKRCGECGGEGKQVFVFGYSKEPCEDCGGRGERSVNVPHRCRACEGSGLVACSTCEGEGKCILCMDRPV